VGGCRCSCTGTGCGCFLSSFGVFSAAVADVVVLAHLLLHGRLYVVVLGHMLRLFLCLCLGWCVCSCSCRGRSRVFAASCAVAHARARAPGAGICRPLFEVVFAAVAAVLVLVHVLFHWRFHVPVLRQRLRVPSVFICGDFCSSFCRGSASVSGASWAVARAGAEAPAAGAFCPHLVRVLRLFLPWSCSCICCFMGVCTCLCSGSGCGCFSAFV